VPFFILAPRRNLCLLRLPFGVGFNKLAWGAPAAIVVVAVAVAFDQQNV